MGPVAAIERVVEIGSRTKHAVAEGREAASSVSLVLSDARHIAGTAREFVPSKEQRRAARSRRRWLVVVVLVLVGCAIGFVVWRARSRRAAFAPDEPHPFDESTDRSAVEAVESTAPDAFGAVVVEEQADQATHNEH